MEYEIRKISKDKRTGIKNTEIVNTKGDREGGQEGCKGIEKV